MVPYDEAAVGNGPINPGSARARQVNLVLAEGPAGLGDLEVSVTADATNALFEQNATGTGESNDGASFGAQSVLAPYPDLQVQAVSVFPPGLDTGNNSDGQLEPGEHR